MKRKAMNNAEAKRLAMQGVKVRRRTGWAPHEYIVYVDGELVDERGDTVYQLFDGWYDSPKRWELYKDPITTATVTITGPNPLGRGQIEYVSDPLCPPNTSGYIVPGCAPCNRTFADDVCPRCAGDMATVTISGPNTSGYILTGETKIDEIRVNPEALRYNTGKVDYTLIPVEALEAEARVWMAGEVKYGRLNWQKLWGDQTTDVVLASLLRHAYAIQRGEDIDPETGLPHAAAIRCNAGMLCYALEKGVQIRPVTESDTDLAYPLTFKP